MMTRVYRLGSIMLVLLLSVFTALADYNLPQQQNPPRLVNDFAHVLSGQQEQQLEEKLREFDRTTSTQISVVTINTLDGYDVADYGLALFNKWGIGQAKKQNGVLVLAAIQDHKVTIRVGSGLEGVLTDAKSGQIIRNEIVPAFREQDYFTGLSNAATAIIAVTKGEYTSEGQVRQKHVSGTAILLFIIFIIIILRVIGRGGGGGGGNYMSRRGGLGGFATGMILGNLLGGGNRGGGWGGGGSDWGGGGGGWGGFGGGGSSGGGASGSW